MLTEAFPKLNGVWFVRALRAFVRSPFYIAAVALLMLMGCLLSLELVVFYLDCLLVALDLLLGEDALGTIPVVCCVYMSISPENSPSRSPETSVLIQNSTIFQFIVLGVLLFILLVGRLTMSLLDRKHRTPRPALLLGFILLGASYLLGGAFSPYYTLFELGFAVVEIFSLAGLYLYFYYTVDWEKVESWYIPALFTAIGIGMLFEIADMYTLPGAIEGGKFFRDNLYTGWGTYNNIGCVTVLCVPAVCCFSLRSRHGWIFTALSCLLMLGVFFTQSRGSILFGGIVFLGSVLAVLITGEKKTRIGNVIVYCVAAAAFFTALYYWKDGPFEELFKTGMKDSGRFEIYRNCLHTFREYPVFGAGFFGATGVLVDAPVFTRFAHNTVVQLLSSGGIVAMLAYLYHRYETVKLLVVRFTPEKLCLGLAIASILATSLVDMHIFAIGPGMMYGILLVTQERADLVPKRELFSKKLHKRAER